MFSSFLNNRYEFNNIESFFSDELNSLGDLSEVLEQVHGECEFGVMKGNLSVLKNTVNKVYKRLRERVSM